MPRPKKIHDPDKIAADNDLLNRVSRGFGSSSDRDLAKRLGIPKSTMAKVRRGEVELAWQHRVVLMDKLGFLKVRRSLSFVLPEAMMRQVEQFTNSAFDRITRQRFERELASDDANLVNFIDSFPAISNSEVFNSHCGLSDADKDSIRAGAELTVSQRAKLIEAFQITDANYWKFDFTRLIQLINDTSVLLDEIERLAFPLDRNAEVNAALIESLERHFGGRGRLADIVDLQPSQLSQIKKGEANLGMRARLKILAEMERASDNPEMLDFDDLDNLANNPG